MILPISYKTNQKFHIYSLEHEMPSPKKHAPPKICVCALVCGNEKKTKSLIGDLKWPLKAPPDAVPLSHPRRIDEPAQKTIIVYFLVH